MPPVLVAGAVSKRYGRTQALHGVDLEVGAGEYVALLGESGIGNSLSVWLEADLTKYTKHRSGALFMVCLPGEHSWLSVWPCVRPWTEWNPLFIQHDHLPADVELHVGEHHAVDPLVGLVEDVGREEHVVDADDAVP